MTLGTRPVLICFVPASSLLPNAKQNPHHLLPSLRSSSLQLISSHYDTHDLHVNTMNTPNRSPNGSTRAKPVSSSSPPPGNTYATLLKTYTSRLTPSELLIALLYPATLVLMSLFTSLSPSAAATTSYFSHKRNIFNVYFVKYGWLWTSAIFAVHTSRLHPSVPRSKAFLRWALVTLWWIAVTQWCFGAPLMDRTFLWTGGSCERLVEMEREGGVIGQERSMSENAGRVMTSATCRLRGGKWTGGHDLSGHVFMLTHASLFLWAEAGPRLRKHGITRGGWQSWVVFAGLGLWWWMLAMTGLYFHTAFEKVCCSG